MKVPTKAIWIIAAVILIGALAAPMMHLLSHVIRPSLAPGAPPPPSFPLVLEVKSPGDATSRFVFVAQEELTQFKSANPSATLELSPGAAGELHPSPGASVNFSSRETAEGLQVHVEYRDSDYGHIGEYLVRGGMLIPTYYRIEHGFIAIAAIAIEALLVVFAVLLVSKLRAK